MTPVTKKQTLFSPILSKRTFEEISSEIKKLIFKGVLKPGDRLPSESELAAQFKVGRQTVREALRILELSGFIVVQQGYGGGPIVEDTILSRIAGLFFDALQFEKITEEELTRARIRIEGMVLADALEAADESDFRALEENILRAKEKIGNGVLATPENLEFHKILAEASKNQVFVVVTGAILAVLGELLGRLPPDLAVSGQAVSFHQEILKAIKEKKKQKASKLLEEHLKDVRHRLLTLTEDRSA